MTKFLLSLLILVFSSLYVAAQQKKNNTPKKSIKPKTKQPVPETVANEAEIEVVIGGDREVEVPPSEPVLEIKVGSVKKLLKFSGGPSGESGLRYVIDGEKLGFIDSQNTLVIPLIYDAFSVPSDFRYNHCILKKNGRAGVIDKYNNQIIPFMYDNIRSLNEINDERNIYISGFITQLDGKWGIFNIFGNRTVPHIYDSMVTIVDNLNGSSLLSVSKNTKAGIIDQLGSIVVPIIYNNSIIQPVGLKREKYQVIEKGSAKILDIKKNKVFINGYSHIIYEYQESPSKKMLFTAKRTNEGAWGIIDEDENILIPFEYEEVKRTQTSYGSSNHYIVKKNGKFGIYDINANKLVVEPKFDKLNYTYGGVTGDEYYYGSIGNKWGILNKGNDILGFEYDEIVPKGENILEIKKGTTVSYFDLRRRRLLSEKDRKTWIEKNNYLNVMSHTESRPSEYFLAQKHTGEYGLIDADENVIVPFDLGFSSNVRVGERNNSFYPISFIVERDGKYGLFNKDSKSILPECKYSDIRYLYQKDYFIGFIKDKKCLLKNGQEILPLIYDDIQHLDNDRVQLTKDNKFGIWNFVNNTYFLDLKYDYLETISSYYDNYYILGIDGKRGLIKDDKQLILPMEYDMISYKRLENCFMVGQKGKVGIFDAKTNKMIIPIEYEVIAMLKNNFVKVFKDNKWAIIHLQYPNVNTPFIYEDVTMVDDNIFLLDGKKCKYIKDKMVEIPN